MTRPMVLIDGIVFENSVQTGIWRVFFEVMSRTSEAVDYKLLLGAKSVQPIPENVAVIRSEHRANINSRRQVVKKVQRRLDTARIRREFPNAIWHSTFFSPDPRLGGKSVVTVHDMIAEEYFLAYPAVETQIDVKRKCLAAASAVLTNSKQTQCNVLRYFPELKARTRVALLGCEHLNRPTSQTARPQAAVGEYVLFLGNRRLYKNFECLVRAVASTQWPEDLGVVVVGAPLSRNELGFLRSFNVQDEFREVGQVSDEQLGDLMRCANCFVFPSLAEGFGLPTVEAQLNSCPAIVSDLPIFREVAGDGALFFDPHDPESLASSVRLLNTSLDRAQLVQRGCENVRRFSWDETASVTLACYREVFNS